MRKALYIILAVMVVFSLTASQIIASPVYNRSSDTRILTYTQVNSAGPTLATAVTTNQKLIGYVHADSANGEVALFDASKANAADSSDTDVPSTTTVFSETNVLAHTTSVVIFPFPRKVNNGLVVQMSTSTGSVTVFYE